MNPGGPRSRELQPVLPLTRTLDLVCSNTKIITDRADNIVQQPSLSFTGAPHWTAGTPGPLLVRWAGPRSGSSRLQPSLSSSVAPNSACWSTTWLAAIRWSAHRVSHQSAAAQPVILWSSTLWSRHPMAHSNPLISIQWWTPECSRLFIHCRSPLSCKAHSNLIISTHGWTVSCSSPAFHSLAVPIDLQAPLGSLQSDDQQERTSRCWGPVCHPLELHTEV